MASVSLPGLSQLMNWPTEHLIEAAERWTATADRRTEVFTQVWQDSFLVEWERDGAEALQSRTVMDKEKVDGLSGQEARKHLTDTAVDIAKRISAALPGQGWNFSPDPNEREIDANGTHCDNGLTEDIARRPIADSVEFKKPFSASQFDTAIDILRQEAAKFGVKSKQGESSLFNESSKRDYQIEGNGYTLRILQINGAGLMLTGPCVLMQKVLDLPPGQLPPE